MVIKLGRFSNIRKEKKIVTKVKWKEGWNLPFSHLTQMNPGMFLGNIHPPGPQNKKPSSGRSRILGIAHKALPPSPSKDKPAGERAVVCLELAHRGHAVSIGKLPRLAETGCPGRAGGTALGRMKGQQAQVEAPPHTRPSWVPGGCLRLSKPQFPHMWNEDDHYIYGTGPLTGSKGGMYMKCFQRVQNRKGVRKTLTIVHRKDSVNKPAFSKPQICLL